MKVLGVTGQVLRINAPDWFQLPQFQAFLDRATHPKERQRLATFHRHGDPPNEFSDIFVVYDAALIGLDHAGHQVGAGQGSDIFGVEGLEDIWDAIVAAAQKHRIDRGIVWISNLPMES